MDTTKKTKTTTRDAGTKKIYPFKRGLVLGLILLGLIGFFGRNLVKDRLLDPAYARVSRMWIDPEPVIIFKEAPKPKYVLRTTFVDDAKTFGIQSKGTMMDACRILQQCFAGSDVYGSPEVCYRNLDPTIKYYDSGFMVEEMEGKEDRLVGFMSVHRDIAYKGNTQTQRKQNNLQPQHENYYSLIVYNVCVDEERRGKGVAKAMIPQFLDALVKHYKLERNANATGREIDPKTGMPIPPLLIGLDVDLTSESIADAFALYAKLGFVRWWTPCTSVANHKWASLIDTQFSYQKDGGQVFVSSEKKDAYGNIKRPAGLLPTHNSDFPMAKLLWDPAPYLKNAFNLGSSAKASKRPDHFCMYKFYSDSFHSMAKALLPDAEPKEL